MSMYAEIKEGSVSRVGMRPKWFYDDGSPVTDGTLAEHGWLPVVRDPQHDPETEVARERDPSEWTVEVDRVLVTYDVSAKPPPSANDVIRERNRRLAVGFSYDFTDVRGIHQIGTTTEDMDGWDEVSKAASALIATGNGAANITIFTDTGPCEVTANEWQLVLVAAMQFRQPIFAASFPLMAQDPIPADYANDGYWPQ